MAKFTMNNIAGQRFGKLVAIDPSHQYKGGQYYWNCQCDCGNFAVVMATKMVNGKTKSCGCLKFRKGQNQTHGMKKHPLYSVWGGIKERCLNVKSKKYPDYGGRGIKMSEEWRLDFMAFYNDMKDGYEKGLQIGRKDNDEGYFKWNCEWQTNVVNQNNKRNNVFITHNGETRTIADWGKVLNVKDDTIGSRYRKGNDVQQVLFGRIIIPTQNMMLPNRSSNVDHG